MCLGVTEINDAHLRIDVEVEPCLPSGYVNICQHVFIYFFFVHMSKWLNILTRQIILLGWRSPVRLPIVIYQF